MASTEVLLYTDVLPSEQAAADDLRTERYRRTSFHLLRDLVAELDRGVRVLGDGLLATFAGPADALDCAIAFRSAVTRHNKRHPDDAFDYRVGIHAGEPILDEEDLLSDSVALIRHLCRSAPPGRIRASAELRELVGDNPSDGVTLVPVDDAEDIEIFEVRAEVAAVRLPAPSDLLLPAGITTATAPELDELMHWWKESCEGNPRLAFVSGHGGMGKTTMLGRLAHRVHAEGSTVLYSRACDYPSPPFGLLRRGLAPYLEACPGRLLREHVRAAGPALYRAFPDLFEAPPSVVDEADTVGALASLVLDAALESPLLFLLDDLHLADAGTLAVLEQVVGSVEPASLCIVGTYDAARLHPKHRLAGVLSSVYASAGCQHLRLKALDGHAVEDMVIERLGQKTPTGVRAAVREAAEGRPLILGEILRYLEQVPQRDRKRTRIPEGLRELVASRFGDLPRWTTEVASAAAVLGDDVDPVVLGGLTGLEAEPLLGELNNLVEAGMLRTSEGGYTFIHPLIRESVYENVETVSRERLHLNAARAIEGGGQDPWLVAAHLRRAGSAAEGSEVINACVEAGDAALQLGSQPDAEDHRQLALRLAEALGLTQERDALDTRLADPEAFVASAVEDVVPEPSVATETLTVDPDANAEADVVPIDPTPAPVKTDDDAHRLAVLSDVISEPLEPNGYEDEQAVEAILTQAALFPDGLDLTEARATIRNHFEPEPKGPKGAAVLLLCSMVDALEGCRRDSTDGAERVVDLAENLGHTRLRILALISRGWHLWAAGQIGVGMGLVDRAWSLADEVEDAEVAVAAARTLGRLRLALLDLPGARAALIRETAKRRLSPDSLGHRLLRDAIASVDALCGRQDEAARLLSEADLPDSVGDAGPLVDLAKGRWEEAERRWRVAREDVQQQRRGPTWFSDCLFARMLSTAGNPDRARTLLEETLAVVADKIIPAELWVRAELALLCAIAPDTQAAADNLGRCEQLLGGGEDWYGLTGRVHLARAVYDTLDDPWEGGMPYFRRATATFTRYQMLWDEAECLFLWGHAMLEGGHPDGSYRLDRAGQIYEDCGASKVWRARLRGSSPWRG